MNKVKRQILLNPGPATTTDTVKYAQVVPDICPREEAFGQLVQSIVETITKLAVNTEQQANYTTVLFGGSGTAGIEAVLSSAVAQGTAILIINNGAYGQRLLDIANVYDLMVLEYKSPPNEPINLEKLEQLIRQSTLPLRYLAVVHHETTTGLLNNISEIGQLCQKYHLSFIVDAMSSFAAIPIDMESMKIDYLITSSNKNIQGMAGVAIIIASKRGLEKIRGFKPRCFYLNLYAQYDFFQKYAQFRFTPPVQTLYALKQALDELISEGIAKRYQRYQECWNALVEGLAKLGLRHIVDEQYHSKLITAIYEPNHPNYSFNDMHDVLLSKGFTIYPGKLIEQQTFRIANIGDITSEDIHHFLIELQEYLHSLDRIGEKS